MATTRRLAQALTRPFEELGLIDAGFIRSLALTLLAPP